MTFNDNRNRPYAEIADDLIKYARGDVRGPAISMAEAYRLAQLCHDKASETEVRPPMLITERFDPEGSKRLPRVRIHAERGRIGQINVYRDHDDVVVQVYGTDDSIKPAHEEKLTELDKARCEVWLETESNLVPF